MEEKKSISIIYEKSKTSNTVPITGALGGPVPTGLEILVHFFVEYPSVPNSTEHKLKGERIVDPQGGRSISRGDVTREIQFSGLMAPQTAIKIGEFLIQNGKMLLNKK